MTCFQKPLHFIVALASYSTLIPEQLGWNPLVEVWDGDYVVPLYRAKIQQFSSTYHVPWVISAFSSFQISESQHWSMATLCDDSVSHIAGCKTAVGKSNNCDGGCVAKRLEKQEWKSEIFVVAQLICWPPSLSDLYLCHETIVAMTSWTWQWCTGPHELFVWTGRRCW